MTASVRESRCLQIPFPIKPECDYHFMSESGGTQGFGHQETPCSTWVWIHPQSFSICASGVQEGGGIEGQQTDSRLVSKGGNFLSFISVWLFYYLLKI